MDKVFEYSLKTLLVIILIALGAGLINAQSMQDAVYLKNGSMVRGEVVENIVDSHVKIQTVDGSIWVFHQDEVREVSKIEEYDPKRVITISEKGFYNASSLGAMMGNNGRASVVTASAQTVCGYKINPHVSAGLGVALENFYPALAPVFIEGRYDLLDKKFTPFAALQAGYAIPLDNHKGSDEKWVNKGGATAEAMVGIRNYVTDNIGFTLSAGYRHQQSVSVEDYWWFAEGDQARIRNQYNRVVLRAGVLFN